MQFVARLRAVFTFDLRVLAIFRIGLGGLLCVDTLTRATDLSAHYTDFGVLPSAPFLQYFANPQSISLHLANGRLGWQVVLFALSLAAGLGVLLGYRTRLATVVGWALLVSVQNRNPMLLNGGDVLFRMLFFWAMFLPIGLRMAVDSALAKPELNRESNEHFSGATVALTLQLVLVYLCTVFLKTGKEWWSDGTASYYALSLAEFTTSFGVWLHQWWGLLRLSTYAVYFLECVTPILILLPFCLTGVRIFVVGSLALMHIGFDLVMRLGIFPWVDIVALVPLIPGPVFDWLAVKTATPTRRRLVIYFDGGCGFCRKCVLLLREFLLIDGTRIAAAADSDQEIASLLASEQSWVVVDSLGHKFLRWQALVVVLEYSPLIGALCRSLPLRSLTRVGDNIYRLIASRRQSLGKLSSRLLPERKLTGPQLPLAASGVSLLLIAFIGVWNLKTLPNVNISIPAQFEAFGMALRLDQKWNMFAPFPVRASGWLVIPGELRDGTKVDLMTGKRGTVSYDRPELVSALFPNARWRKYLMNIQEDENREYRLYFGKWLCRTWNSWRDVSEQLIQFEIVLMRTKTVFPGELAKTDKVSLWHHECFKKAGAD